MREQDSSYTARMMIQLHGLQAQAIANERAAESRAQGDTAGLDRWQQVHAAICELRRTAPHGDADTDMPQVESAGWGGRDRTSV
ncbi:MAG TPA: hypothetical protein VIG49_07815 [Acetobacteraceae bacterium]